MSNCTYHEDGQHRTDGDGLYLDAEWCSCGEYFRIPGSCAAGVWHHVSERRGSGCCPCTSNNHNCDHVADDDDTATEGVTAANPAQRNNGALRTTAKAKDERGITPRQKADCHRRHMPRQQAGGRR